MTSQKAGWLETQRLTYTSKSGALVQSVATAYDTNIGSLPAQIATTLYNGSGTVQKQTQIKYDTYSNVIEKDESDFYSCTGSPCPSASTPPTGWLRKTFTTYQYQNQPSWVTANIVNKPSQVLVTDGSGHPYSLTQYGYDQTAVTGPAGYMNHDDQNYGVGSTKPRGNLTSESRCSVLSNISTVTPENAASACSTWLTTTHTYDLTGQRLSTKDPRLNQINYGYTDTYVNGSPAKPTNSYLTSVTYPNGATDTYSYYYDTGEQASHTDWNSQLTTYDYADPNNINRITDIYGPPSPQNGRAKPHTQYSYVDGSSTSMTKVDPVGVTSSTFYDGLGRVMRTKLTTYPGAPDYVDTTYDPLGRIYSVSNPYLHGQSNYGLVYYAYDAIGRKILQVQQDNTQSSPSLLSWIYGGNTVLFQDENGNQWKRYYDGVGRLSEVQEPTVASQTPTMITNYAYDPLSNLLSVSQNGVGGDMPRTRTFTYDSLSRLITSTNPETGTVCYGTWSGGSVGSGNCQNGYDGNGNLVAKTDAQNIQTTSQYDALNRLTSITYPPNTTPSRTFSYDAPGTNAAGHLTQETSLFGTFIAAQRNYVSFDPMGRLTNENQCVAPNCPSTVVYSPAYTYDLAGNLTTAYNGVASEPITLTYTYDGANHLKGITSSLSGTDYPPTLMAPPASGSEYDAFGHLINAQLAINSIGTAELTLARTYDIRGRYSFGSYTTAGQTTPIYSDTPGYDHVGNVTSLTDTAMGNWTYSYDYLNRLSSATAPTTTTPANTANYKGVSVVGQTMTWTYDDFGNRIGQAITAPAGTSSNLPEASASYLSNNRLMSNQFTGTVGYDQAGNVTGDGLNAYTYDPESRICALTEKFPPNNSLVYVYDAEGNRVMRGTIGNNLSAPCNVTSDGYSPVHTSVLGQSGEEFSDIANNNVWGHTNIFANGELLATYTPSGLYYAMNDWLGTKRGQASAATGALQSVVQSFAFGDGLWINGADATPQHFTGKIHDVESGNDYFGARFYDSYMGRYLSPDWSDKPEAVPYANLGDPQSLNLYSYGGNNPLTDVDADGHCQGFECQTQQDWIAEHQIGNLNDQQVAAAGLTRAAQQQNTNQAVGNTTEGSLAKVLTNEDGSLSTPKNGNPQELVDGKTALANAIYNNANLAHPQKVAPDTGTASAQDAQIMQGVVTSRTNGGADPVQGRVYYGTSHTPDLTSRSAGNGLKGAAGRESVFAKFGPFKDSISSRPTYIYIYNNPGH